MKPPLFSVTSIIRGDSAYVGGAVSVAVWDATWNALEALKIQHHLRRQTIKAAAIIHSDVAEHRQ